MLCYSKESIFSRLLLNERCNLLFRVTSQVTLCFWSAAVLEEFAYTSGSETSKFLTFPFRAQDFLTCRCQQFLQP